MADPFDIPLSKAVHEAISQPGVLEGEDVKAHSAGTVICIGTITSLPYLLTHSLLPALATEEVHTYVLLHMLTRTAPTLSSTEGPQFSTRSESLLYRSLPTTPPISVINMSAVPECKLFREAEIAYALVCMSTDYDSWHQTNEGVSVEMVMGHMVANGANAKRAVAAVLEGLSKDEEKGAVVGERLAMASRGGIMGLQHMRVGDGREEGEAVGRLRWLFGDRWVDGPE